MFTVPFVSQKVDLAPFVHVALTRKGENTPLRRLPRRSCRFPAPAWPDEPQGRKRRGRDSKRTRECCWHPLPRPRPLSTTKPHADKGENAEVQSFPSRRCMEVMFKQRQPSTNTRQLGWTSRNGIPFGFHSFSTFSSAFDFRRPLAPACMTPFYG